MSLFVPKKTQKSENMAMKNGELVGNPRSVSTASFKPIVKPGKPAAEPRMTMKERIASMSMEPMDTKSKDWSKPVDISAVRKEIKTPTTFLPELKETHKRRTYTLPKYKPSADLKSVEELFSNLKLDNTPKDEADGEYIVKGLSVDLMPHQIEGVKFLKRREKKKISGGLLCDDMGLGKTVQSIALILKNKPKKDHEGPITTLVVGPLAVMDQWAEEVQSKAPGLSVDTYQGSKRTTKAADLAKYNVIVTTYDTVVAEFKRFQEEKPTPLFDNSWYRIIADEAHIFRNKKSQMSQAMARLKSDGKRWALTGTPINNSINDLYSILRFIRVEPYNDEEFWETKVEIPLQKGNKGAPIEIVKKLLHSMMLRREQKIIKLPKCTRVRSEVKLQDEEHATIKLILSSTEPKLTKLLRIRQACDDIALLPAPEAKKESEEKEVKSKVEQVKTEVKSEIDDADDLAALLGGVQISDQSSTSTKTKEIMKIINTEKTRKTVIFSSFVTMLDRVAETLRADDIGYKIYHGKLSAEARKSILHDFRSNKDTPVLLCSLTCAAVGINITAASRVIMAEPWWNPMVVDQAVNRVHRIGQAKPVDVYEMMVVDGIEERIFALQDRKRNTAAHMLEPDQVLNAADIEFLLYGNSS